MSARDTITHHGNDRGVGTAIKFSRTTRVRPKFGEHRAEVLREHGFAEAENAALEEARVLHTARRR